LIHPARTIEEKLPLSVKTGGLRLFPVGPLWFRPRQL